jgi:hypothetical protein
VRNLAASERNWLWYERTGASSLDGENNNNKVLKNVGWGGTEN